MNIQDRRRASNLVEQEFHDRLRLVRKDVSQEDIANESEAILKRTKLATLVSKLNAANKLKDSLEIELSEKLAALRGSKSKKRRGYGCECHERYQDILEELARANIIQTRNAAKLEADLLKTQRKLLAEIEVCESTDALARILKKAGLV